MRVCGVRLRLVCRRRICGSRRKSAPLTNGKRSLVRPFPHHSTRDRVRDASQRVPLPPFDALLFRLDAPGLNRLQEARLRLRILSFVWVVTAALMLGLAGCAPMPPSAADLQAKRFEPLPDKGVVYLFRDYPDFIDDGATIMVDDQMQGTTYPGTYLRLELEPGPHRIAGFAGDAGAITIDIGAGQIRFVQQTVIQTFIGPARSHFRVVDPNYGRQAVLRHELVGAR